MELIERFLFEYKENSISDIDKEKLKKLLISKMLDYSISDNESEILIHLLDNTDFRGIIMRIFDLNPGSVLAYSRSQTAMLNFLSSIGRHIKNFKFNIKIKKPYYRDSRKTVIAEGDSWFEYPIFINDIPDWLIKNNKIILYSMANAGDWISGMVYEEKYIEQLSAYQPEILLVSGGGNDLVGNGRLSLLVNKPSLASDEFKYIKPDKDLIVRQNFDNGETDAYQRADMIIDGTRFLGKDYFALLKTFEIMYKKMFTGIFNSGKFRDIRIITNGYDFPVPSNNRNIFINPIRLLIGNGNWLYYPLVKKAISNPGVQQNISSALIYYFNEMLISVAEYCNSKAQLHYVFHVDSRAALKKKDWADELHPYSKPFKKISNVYLKCIEGHISADLSIPYIYPVRLYA